MTLNQAVLDTILQEIAPIVPIQIELVGNGDYKPFEYTKPLEYLKRVLLLKQGTTMFLAINPMGSHFTKEGMCEDMEYAGKHWD